MLKILSENESEALFKVMDQSIEILQDELSTSYIDALIETGDNLIEKNVQVEDGKPSTTAVTKLTTLYQSIDLSQLDASTIRRAIQYSMLKVTQKDTIQPNHQLTPDTIGMIIGYLVTSLLPQSSELEVLDLAVGTGNLMTTVINELIGNSIPKVKGIGVDNDDTLLAIAQISANLQGLNLALYHQDSLGKLAFGKSDVAISDLPVGYYPLDENAKKYTTSANDGHSYVHHLLIEQSMSHVKDGGFGIFLVPTNLFQSGQAKQLLKWMQGSAYLQGFLNLPKALFLNDSAQKSILILQNHGDGALQANKVMLGEFPSFKNQAQFKKFMGEILEWEQQDLFKK